MASWCFCQEVKVANGNLSVDFKTSKKVSNTLNLNSTSKIKSKELQKISVKCKVESLNKEVVDINKFSLVDHKNKLRYRPTDISFQPVMGYLVYEKLFKEDVNYGNMAKHQAGIQYKPEIKDSYNDYAITDYVDVQIPMTFAVGFGKQKTSIVYFEPHNYRNFQALFFFAIVEDAKNPDLVFYYGNEKITSINL